MLQHRLQQQKAEQGRAQRLPADVGLAALRQQTHLGPPQAQHAEACRHVQLPEARPMQVTAVSILALCDRRH